MSCKKCLQYKKILEKIKRESTRGNYSLGENQEILNTHPSSILADIEDMCLIALSKNGGPK